MCKQGAYGTGAPGVPLKNIKWIVWNSRRLLKKEQKKKGEKNKTKSKSLVPIIQILPNEKSQAWNFCVF